MSLDLAGLVLLLVGNGALYAGWLLLCLAQDWPLSETVLVAAVGLWCQILASELALGWIGLLDLVWLGSVNLAVLIAILLVASRRLGAGQVRRQARAAQSSLRTIAASKTALALLGLLAAWLLWTVFLGLIFPPYASDEYYYHMPIVGSILQSRNLDLIQTAIPWIKAYPKHSELFVLWNSIFLHRDTFADLTMLPFALAGGLATYAAARRLGAEPAAAVIGGSIFVFAPTVLIQMKSTYNDVMIGGLWAIGLCFVLPARAMRSPGLPVTVLVTGAVAGLILGVKYSGPVYVGSLGLLIAFQLVRQVGLKRSLGLLVAFSSCALLVGGYWYVFNLVTFGNPLWPFALQVGGQTVFAGTLDSAATYGNDSSVKLIGDLPYWQRLFYAWFERMEQVSVDSRLAGLGPLWIVIGVPSVIFWAVSAWLQRRLLPWIVIGVHLLLLALIPLNWIPRYSLFLLALGGAAVGAISSTLLPPARRWLRVLAVTLALFAMFNSLDHLYFSVARIQAFVALPESERTGPRYDPPSFGPTYTWVAQSLPPGSVIAYANNVGRPYPLWGSGFEHRVISITTTDPQRYVSELRAAGVEYVFVGLKGEQAAILAADPSVHLAFAGGDLWQVFAID